MRCAQQISYSLGVGNCTTNTLIHKFVVVAQNILSSAAVFALIFFSAKYSPRSADVVALIHNTLIAQDLLCMLLAAAPHTPLPASNLTDLVLPGPTGGPSQLRVLVATALACSSQARAAATALPSAPPTNTCEESSLDMIGLATALLHIRGAAAAALTLRNGAAALVPSQPEEAAERMALPATAYTAAAPGMLAHLTLPQSDVRTLVHTLPCPNAPRPGLFSMTSLLASALSRCSKAHPGQLRDTPAVAAAVPGTLLGALVEALHADAEASFKSDAAYATVAALQRCMELFRTAGGCSSNGSAHMDLEDVLSWAGCAGLPTGALEDPEYAAITACLVPVVDNRRAACLPLRAAVAVTHVAAAAALAAVPGACNLLQRCHVAPDQAATSSAVSSSAVSAVVRIRQVSSLLTVVVAEASAAADAAVELARCLSVVVGAATQAAAGLADASLASTIIESLPSVSTLNALVATITAPAQPAGAASLVSPRRLAAADAAAALLLAADARRAADAASCSSTEAASSVDITLSTLAVLSADAPPATQHQPEEVSNIAHLTGMLSWLLVGQLDALVEAALREEGCADGVGQTLTKIADWIAPPEVHFRFL
jgi:hypothetical protein